MAGYIRTHDLSVGYDGNILIRNINIEIEKGKILTLIGPNGAGKTTILKTITRHLRRLGGGIFIGGEEISTWSRRDMARQLAVVFTGHVRSEMMSCSEVVAMGRYPYTNMLGTLTEEDREIVHNTLEQVGALDLADRDFATLSDGQKQRIMLARALCQEPRVIVLDEPTAFLDIRYKVELLDILRTMAREKKITVILSLHEIDLAAKLSDYLVCIRDREVARFGTPEEILRDGTIEELYHMEKGSYDMLFGSVELPGPAGEPRVFVVAGGGFGIPCYRALQKRGIPFATGILFENDMDFRLASRLTGSVVSAPAFEPVTKTQYQRALDMLSKCTAVVDAGTPVGTLNAQNKALLEAARRQGTPILQAEELSGGKVPDPAAPQKI